MDNYKLKLTIFLLLLIILGITLFYAIFGFSLSYLSEDKIKENRKAKENLISYIKINDLELIYDKNNNIYYYTIPDTYENKQYALKLDLDDSFKYKIVNHSTNIIKVNYKEPLDIIIYNDKYYYEMKLIITNLPLISITTDTEITDNDTNSVFKYINPYNLDEVITYNSKINIRGATSKRYDKKSYKVEMFDKNYENEKNINISNFYYGSTFILDAMFRDNSKIRNVFSNDIWNVISDDFTNVDVYSEYVELFINGQYVGLYSFTEPINRKNLNLNKSSLNNTSVIIKSNETTIPESNKNFSNITENKYLDYELKYPNDTELYSISWEKILSKLSKYYDYNIEKTYENLNEIFDMNNYIDLLIFNVFVNNTDNNLRKNNYYYLKNLDSKINIHPWDMEFSFGLKYDEDAKYNYKKDLNDYNDISFDIEYDNLVKLSDLIVNRYWNLRRNVLTEEYLDNLLNKYLTDLNKGAANRDSDIWVDYDIDKEIEEIKIWMHNRIKVFDNYIRGLEHE